MENKKPFISGLQIKTATIDLGLYSVEFLEETNCCIVDGPRWLREMDRQFEILGRQVNQTRIVREPMDRSALKWNTVDILVGTVPSDVRNSDFDLSMKGSKDAVQENVSKEEKNEQSHSKRIHQFGHYGATAVLSLLSGGLFWLATNSF